MLKHAPILISSSFTKASRHQAHQNIVELVSHRLESHLDGNSKLILMQDDPLLILNDLVSLRHIPQKRSNVVENTGLPRDIFHHQASLQVHMLQVQHANGFSPHHQEIKSISTSFHSILRIHQHQEHAMTTLKFAKTQEGFQINLR